MTDKTRLQTYNFLLENKSIEDILNQPNATFKNKNGNDKQRHGGLTIKFSNDIDVKDKPSKVVVNDKLKNNIISDINEVSVTEILTKEIGTQIETIGWVTLYWTLIP
ncbi:hypothetical protein [Spiroplasma endosymbiont of Zeiraphera isertana]|uniref:hypothetical protein n=1 Tax=Spiroplasma endosymbiont of Zeiraphera isertana TaxID=3066313 RepID=UPI00313DAADD